MSINVISCTKCGQRFEKLQKNDETETMECPNCGSTEVIKEISSFSTCGAAPAASPYSGG